MKREGKTFVERIAVPEEALRNVPLVMLHGRHLVSVENHRGVVEYTRELVRVAVKGGCVSIRGTDLQLGRMTRRQVEVCGTIFAVETS